MHYSFPINKETMVTARSSKRISTKSAHAVSKKINNTNFKKAKTFVDILINKKKNISGKYFTKASKGIEEMLKTVEANAISRGFEPDEMRLRISVNQGPKMRRSRRKSWFGSRIKVSNIYVVLEKLPEKKKVKKRTKEETKK